jgi:ABC-type multidrug transport system fused ATPase/permease subunit
MKDIFSKIFKILSKKEKKHAIFIVFLIFIMAIFEMLGVASIMPFITLVSNPDLIETNYYLSKLFLFSQNLGIEEINQFLIFIGILVFLLIIFSILIKALTTYLQIHFSLMREDSIAKRLLKIYLQKPYLWFLNKNSSQIGKNILSEIQQITTGSILPLMNLIAQGSIIICLIGLLIFINLKIAIIAGGTLTIFYLLFFFRFRNFLLRIGRERHAANEMRYRSVLEAFQGYKIMKFKGLEEFYSKKFSTPSFLHAKYNSLSNAVSLMPRFFIEAISFGGMIILILYLLATNNDFKNIAPIIAVYAFAGYKLLPAFQLFYSSYSQLNYYQPSINNLYNDFKNHKEIKNKDILSLENNISFNKQIKFSEVCFSYPDTAKGALKNLNISIPLKSKVGIIGHTGSGKTTTIDLILGLLFPLKGQVTIDDKLLTEKNNIQWQQKIGYIPQNIFLTDDTILSNIAFGIEKKNINIELAEKAAKIASLHDFIISELPNKYHTIIGENGMRLSGGQRQRIGIARAFYNNPEVVILDEATNSLDQFTENQVINSIINSNQNVTLIIITHRINTIKNCDLIYVIEGGELKDQGTFNELSKYNKYFEKIGI